MPMRGRVAAAVVLVLIITALLLLIVTPLFLPQYQEDSATVQLHDSLIALSISDHFKQTHANDGLNFSRENSSIVSDYHETQLHKLIHKSTQSKAISTLISRIRGQSPQHSCVRDDSLPTHLPPGKYLIALNLHNSEAVIPHLILHLTSLLKNTPNRKDFFISIFESGSEDATKDLLSIFKDILNELDVPHRILAGAGAAWSSGYAFNDRIAFLATIRNRALEPLWPSSSHLSNSSPPSTSPQPAPPPTNPYANAINRALGLVRIMAANPSMKSELHLPPQGFPADRIIFINDVFACSQDMIRLASHDADIACGMDFMGGTLDKGMHFWDNWVTLDINGKGFNWGSFEGNFSSDHWTNSRLAAGLPAAVYRCWNGMVVMRAEPFRRGLRMRSHVDGECAGSECSLMVEDFWRLGFGRVVMDPGVRVVYEDGFDPRMLYSRDGRWKMPFTLWGEVVRAGRIDWGQVKRPERTRCCELLPGQKYVGWEKCLHDYQPFKVNFTDVAVKTGFKYSMVGLTFDYTQGKEPGPGQ